MIRRPPRSTRTDTLVPYTTLFRSDYKTLTAGTGVENNSGGLSITFTASTAARSGVIRISGHLGDGNPPVAERSEEHTSELQSLLRISYAVFCLKQKNNDSRPI